jgi:SagB-type dehydrogenase family enzyme
MFRRDQPVAWAYHRRTSRWPFNMHGLNEPTRETSAFKEDFDSDCVDLDPPNFPSMPLTDALARRSSCRRFASTPIDLTELGTMLHAGYGVLQRLELWGEFCSRPVPSGGGLYPLELYTLIQRVQKIEGGIYHYAPLGHRLEVVRPDALPSHLSSEIFLGQPYLVQAAAIIVITAVVERSLWKYDDRGYRYILLEAGHVAQNINLCAVGLGLVTLNLGGFFDEDMMALLKLDEDREIVIYGIAVGHSEVVDPLESRRPTQADQAVRRF